VRETTARIVELLLRRLLPPPGRHRSAGTPVAVRCVHAPTVRPPRATPASTRPVRGAPGENTGLVRPYVLAHEREVDRRYGRVRSVSAPALSLATV
jgi:hypothetical protein